MWKEASISQSKEMRRQYHVKEEGKRESHPQGEGTEAVFITRREESKVVSYKRATDKSSIIRKRKREESVICKRKEGEKKASSSKKRRGKVAPIHRRRESSTVHKEDEEEEKATPVHKEGSAPFGWCCLFLLFLGGATFPLLLLWSGAAVFHEKQAKQLEVSRVNKLKTWKSKKKGVLKREEYKCPKQIRK